MVRKPTYEELERRIKVLEKETSWWSKGPELTLQASEDKYRSLFDLAPDPVVIVQERQCRLINSAFTRLLGYTEREVKEGLSISALAREHDRDLFDQRYRDRLAGRKTSKILAIDLVSKTGEIIPCETSSTVIHYEGHPAIMTIIRDISARREYEKMRQESHDELEEKVAERTAELMKLNQQMMFEIWERKKAEEALADSEEKFLSFVETTSDLVWETDKKGILTYVSPRSHELYGNAPEEVVGRPICDFLPTDEAKRFSRIYKQAVVSRERISGVEVVSFSEDGRLTNLEIWAFPFFSENGRLLGFRGLTIDTTNRKKTQEALRQSEERLSLALEATKDGIWDWDVRNKKVYASECLKELAGYEIDDAKSEMEDWSSNIHPDHQQQVMEDMQKHLAGRGQYDVDYLYRRPGEEKYRWHNVRGKAFYDEKGKAYRMVGAVRDINERKLAEEALKKRETELNIQSANLEQANVALKVLLQHREKDREELEQKVLANVKELVLPFVEELQKTLSDDKGKALLGIVESNLNEVISPFLRQLTSKYSVLTPKEIQVANLVKEGKTSKEIANLLNTSKFTVDKHRRSLREKLGLIHTKGNLRSRLLSLQ